MSHENSSASQTRGAVDADGASPKPLDPVYVSLVVTDPEVIAALSEHESSADRQNFVNTCLKIGLLSLRAARGTVDGQTVRHEGERLLAGLNGVLEGTGQKLLSGVESEISRYFHPASGAFSARVESLLKNDGELATLIQRQVEIAQQSVAETFATFVGEESQLIKLLSPDGSNAFINTMRSSVDEALKAESEVILKQFSLDHRGGALSRLLEEMTNRYGDLTNALKNNMAEVVSEFSLDREDSALSRLVRRVETTQTTITKEFSLDEEGSSLSKMRKEMNEQLQLMATQQTDFHRDLMVAVERLDTQRKERAKSTAHGAVFEDAVRAALGASGLDESDVLDATGNTTGVIKNCKVGDFVLTLSPDNVAAGAKVVIEAKEDASYNQASTLAECDVARRNRDAGVALFVHSKKTCPAGFTSVHRYGRDIVVVWDADGPDSDIILRVGLILAKALSVREGARSNTETASFKVIDAAIEVIRKQTEYFDELLTSSNTIESANNRTRQRVGLMKANIINEIEKLADQLGNMKATAGGGNEAASNE